MSAASSNAAQRAPSTSGLLDKELPPIPEISSFSGGPDLSFSIDFDAHRAPSSHTAEASQAVDSSGISPMALQSSARRSTEAEDYMNRGLPHPEGSPLLIAGPVSPGPASPALVASAPISPGRSPGAVSVEKTASPEPGDMQQGDGSGLVESPTGSPTASPQVNRRSVQFVRSDFVSDEAPAMMQQQAGSHSRQGSWDPANPSRSRAFMSRLKALAPATSPAAGSPVAARSSRVASGQGDSERQEQEGSDADAEETADEAGVDETQARNKKRRRRSYRPQMPRSQSVQLPGMAQPIASPLSGAITEPNSPFPSSHRLNTLMQRRTTLSDTGDRRGGLSEGEGRDRLSRQVNWRRGSAWMGAGRSDEAGAGGDIGGLTPTGRALGHVRRKTVFGGGFGGGVSDGDAMTPRRPFFTSGDRATTFGAQKWRQMKNTLKLLRQKKEERFDYYKSAELMAELRAGAPAVLMLASMIQRDEHGNKRIPVLLEQLKVHIRDSAPMQDGDSERHWLFTIDLEYGSGPSRMRWTIKRTIREILELHWKYKLALRNDKYLHPVQVSQRPKQPRFPISAFPYVRGLRGLDLDDEDDAVSVRGADDADRVDGGNVTAGEGTATDIEGPSGGGRGTGARGKRVHGFGGGGLSRKSSVAAGAEGSGAGGSDGHLPIDEAALRRRYGERQQRMLEKYLQEMIRWLMFRADSNRLCRFLELSALGVRLAAEGSYHGKECFLHIQSSKGLDFRRVLTPGKVIERHSRKWFLIRQSYIVCVESPENMNIYDVYLIDPKFALVSKSKRKEKEKKNKEKAHLSDLDLTHDTTRFKHHTLTLITSERKVKLWGRNQHLIGQFEESLLDMLKQTPWHQPNRFDSFAPVRKGVFAQWLVDGRDYMWNVSRAIAMAKDVIYIHDWWLSPELYMRRPACISQKWRLDRLLQRKASEGVKIFVIIYRNVEAAVPIDSEYTKFSLLNLHPNIFVQRSPNQFKKNQFFFAHHEKICIVDHDVAFLGGIDLCFGRWDSPQHSLVDDKPTGFEMDAVPKDADHCQLWPGKDYSNPRVQDFFSLRQPYKEMYDRTKVPRMPWHDVGMQVVGQPARDLTRHFIQRWNYVRRGRKPTRPTPFLLPPPDFRQEDLEALGLSGTCEVQILRSASAWSLGVTDVECSIQNAYISMIEESEHFVYMENQFFITSTETLNVKIVNRIGDALVDRVIRAHANDEDWRCVIIIPLMPGFQNSVADQEGTSVRLILQCQYRSICRGENSIFGRLRTAGIEPEDYIQFFSLRQWGKINNNTVLTTEQLYIHAKTIIVDDRVALIGSANINERSLLGDRDSEVAAIVRDTDMISSTMAGEPYLVGRFAHTLRVRLMQEHLGLDTDEIMEEDRQREEFEADMSRIYDENDGAASDFDASSMFSSDNESAAYLAMAPGKRNEPEAVVGADASAVSDGNHGPSRPTQDRVYSSNSFNHDVDLEENINVAPKGSSANLGFNSQQSQQQTQQQQQSASPSPQKASEAVKAESHAKDVAGFGEDRWKAAKRKGIDHLRDSMVIDGREVMVDASFNHSTQKAKGNTVPPLGPQEGEASQNNAGVNTVNDGTAPPPPPPKDDVPTSPHIGSISVEEQQQQQQQQPPMNPLAPDIRLANIAKDCMRDPVNPAFYDEVWARVAENNTKIYRRVFRCLPDSEATNWHEFQEFITYGARFQESMEQRRRAEDTDVVGQHPERHAGGGGAGISVPPPSAIAAVAAVGERVANVMVHRHLHHGGSGGGSGGAATAAAAAAAGSSSVPKTEMEKAAAAENAFKGRAGSVSTGPSLLAPPVPPSSSRGVSSEPLSEKQAQGAAEATSTESARPKSEQRHTTFSEKARPDEGQGSGSNNANSHSSNNTSNNHLSVATSSTATANGGSVKRRRRATTKSSRRGFQGGADELLSKADAEELCKMMQGHLVQFPYDWLAVEESNGNWLYQVDQVAPLQIYN